MSVYSSEEISEKLRGLQGWSQTGEGLSRTFEFETFADAITFVNRIAELAEEADHHPDIDIRFNKVRLGLVSHDAGGVTDRDFDLAHAANEVY